MTRPTGTRRREFSVGAIYGIWAVIAANHRRGFGTRSTKMRKATPDRPGDEPKEPTMRCGALSAAALHLPAHLFDAMGGLHGPVHAGMFIGHSDFSTTRRYVHPQADTVRSAMERARNGR